MSTEDMQEYLRKIRQRWGDSIEIQAMQELAGGLNRAIASCEFIHTASQQLEIQRLSKARSTCDRALWVERTVGIESAMDL